MMNITAALQEHFGAQDGVLISEALSETTMQLPADSVLAMMTALRDEWRFEQLIDIAGIDYADYNGHNGRRFAVVYHLLSLADNKRLRLRVFCTDDDFPTLPSVMEIWPAANWFEREAFDLYGIVFHGHKDLRRLLTDYGFVGHPFRKDFPLSGHVEMRYDPMQKRVIYQPVSIEERTVTPRIIREQTFGKEDSKASD